MAQMCCEWTFRIDSTYNKITQQSMPAPERKRRIIFVITKSNFGGAQRYVYDLAVALPKDRFEVIVAFGGAGVLADRLVAAGIRTVSLSGLDRDINPLKELSVFVALVRLFRHERPDAVHLNSSKIGGLGALA